LIRPLIRLLVLLAALGAAPAHAELNAMHHDQLARGDVLYLDRLPFGRDAKGVQGGTAVAFVRATPTVVWRVLLDYPRHAGLYPRIVAADVIDPHAAQVVVRYRLAIGPFVFSFHVRQDLNPAGGRLAWELAHEYPNDLFRENWGYWQVEPHGHGVLLTHAIAARTMLPGFLTRGAERVGLIKIVKVVRDRAERDG
jgi:polyketide cyclase/dehydrase/lipid transport protein